MAMKPEQSESDKQNGISPVVSTHPHPNITLDKNIDFESINEILSKVFKHDGFRSELQRDAVTQVCKLNRDLFVSLPTGSGKSLIYQLPAVYKNRGLVIVVSPLVALISNQISNARKLGIPCATINSHMAKSWNMQVKDELKKNDTRLRLLYITPETLCSDHFQPYLNSLSKNKILKLFAIDEAHCVSSWGHEFRHDYLKLGQLRARYPDICIVALTATATNKVLKDILDILNLNNPKHMVASTFRENLYYDVSMIDKLDESVMSGLTNFIKHCLGIKSTKKKEEDKKKSFKTTSFKKATTLLTGNGSQTVSSTTTNSGGSSQFVSAAALLTTEKETKPQTKFKSTKKRPTKEAAPILANEAARITSFFKPKPVVVVDLCDSDSDSDKDKRKTSNSDEDIVVVRDDSRVKRLKKEQPIAEEKPDTTVQSVVPKKSNLGVGIIYCRTKATCDDVADFLQKKGIAARPYHSGLTSKERAEIEKDWMDEKVLLICATIAFGMGIDKPNVRVVVHLNMSQSLANYYQESGRAGRDGLKANCRLYYSQSDQNAITFLLRKDMDESIGSSGDGYGGVGGGVEGEGGVERNGRSALSASRRKQTARAAMDRFERMVEYCRSTNKCRHLLLAKEFSLADETSSLAKGCGGSCDYCFRSTKSSSSTSASTSRKSSASTATAGKNNNNIINYNSIHRRRPF